MTDPRSRLPGLSGLLLAPEVIAAIRRSGRAPVIFALREVLTSAREAVAAGANVPTAAELVAEATATLRRRGLRALRPVVNATGVLLHTNLGRAQLSTGAVAAVAAAAAATNLEVDLASGTRGGRGQVVQDALVRLTGAEAALVVNNGAAALVLALAVLCRDREVVISRGEMVEIGGSFRLPDIIAAAGATLCEVGTTNRTYARDYAHGLNEASGAVLRVHPSNYHLEGFVHRPSTAQIAEIARAHRVPLIEDLGSGLLRRHPSLSAEPAVDDTLAQGADVVVFSGDKLLGGPQAGILVGEAELIDRCRRAPLARALRVDKLRLAALEATLDSYDRDRLEELPVWSMVAADPVELRRRAERIAAGCGGTVVPTEGVLGGGAVPSGRQQSWGVALEGAADPLAARLRTGTPPVMARIVDDRVVADLRAVPPELDEVLTAALRAAAGDG